MKYIEFLGLPGAGKTTLAQETRAIVRANQRAVLPKLEARRAIVQKIVRQKSGIFWKGVEIGAHIIGKPLWRLLWEKHQTYFLINFIYHYPALVQLIVESAREVAPPPTVPNDLFSAKALVHWILDPAILYQASYECLDDEVILMQEEGFCQQAYYLLAAFRKASLKIKTLEQYLALIPQPDVLIVLSSDPKQCETRMQARAKGVSSDILRFLSVTDRLGVLQERLELYGKIAAYFEARKVRVVRLDNRHLHTSRQTLEVALGQV